MKSRKIIDEKLTFPIKSGLDYKPSIFCTWKELVETKGILPDDKLNDLIYREDKESGFMNLDYDEQNPKKYYVPCVVVIRPRPETDEEYFKRMKEEEVVENQINEREKLEYLRLKAKFENQ
jgi:hypothetical protein